MTNLAFRAAVLDDFAMERDCGPETLERYLRSWPQFAAELIDLSRELHREPVEEPLSAADQAKIDQAWAWFHGDPS